MSFAIAGSVIAIGAGAAMNNQNEIAGRKAQASQEDLAREGMSAEERMFDKSLELQKPYRDAGYGAIEGIQALNDPNQRAQILGDYYASDEYSQLAGQASANALRGASAQGGLRGGSTYSALENVAPQLGQNFLTTQYNQLTGLANLGAGAASQGAGAYNTLGQNQNQNLAGIGVSQANQILAAGQSRNDFIQNSIEPLNSLISGVGGLFI